MFGWDWQRELSTMVWCTHQLNTTDHLWVPTGQRFRPSLEEFSMAAFHVSTYPSTHWLGLLYTTILPILTCVRIYKSNLNLITCWAFAVGKMDCGDDSRIEVIFLLWWNCAISLKPALLASMKYKVTNSQRRLPCGSAACRKKQNETRQK